MSHRAVFAAHAGHAGHAGTIGLALGANMAAPGAARHLVARHDSGWVPARFVKRGRPA